MLNQNFILGFWGANPSIKLYNQERHLKDDEQAILKYFAGKYERVSFLRQTHSTFCNEITNGSDVNYSNEADAQVTKNPKIILAVRTADCVPIILADPVNRVIGIAHSGWKGTLKGVVKSVAEKMQKAGANLASVEAIIGPCIRQNSYEVSEDFVSRFLSADKSNSRFFRKSTTDSHKHFFDLPACVKDLLNKAGIHQVHDIEIDTFSNKDFFSYRRMTKAGIANTVPRQHNLSFIALQET